MRNEFSVGKDVKKVVNLTIDGKTIEAEEGRTLLEAARREGITIPTLCYDRRLSPYGACRICMVESKQDNRLLAACSTPVAEGMDILTASPAVRKARRKQLTLILLNHPLVCPRCEKGGQCDLQDLVYEYGVDDLPLPWERQCFPPDTLSPLIKRDPNKCILCGKCVRICGEYQQVGMLSMAGSGAQSAIAYTRGNTFDCEFCGQCVAICPTGALTGKTMDYGINWWELDEVDTICPYCGCGCSVTLGVKDGTIRAVGAEPGKGVNQGDLCVKGRFGFGFVHHPDRLTRPLVRRGEGLVEASWAEALDLVASRLGAIKEKYGSDSIAGLSSAKVTNEENYLFQKFMRAVIGTNNIDHCARL